VPALAGTLPPSVLSLHGNDYRRADALPPGGVLLVGSGQTGVQLAEELAAAGRQVTLSVGKCGSVPRRYRGHDIFWWLRRLATVGPGFGTSLPTAAGLPSPAARFACNPQLSGHGGGHDVNLRRMAAGGVRLTGRLEAFDGSIARFRSDLNETLGFVDSFFEVRFRKLCDTFAERLGGPFPPAEFDRFAFDVPEVTEIDLAAAGITTVLWTSGYRPAFDWIDVPVFDELGLPKQQDGRTAVPGLSFIGTPWLVDMGSANLVGLARDAQVVAEAITAD
jgi:putative flavoprotein involved in K+ transport